MAEVNPAESIVGKMDIAFKNRVEELSDGNIRVDLHFSGSLGDEVQVMKLITAPASPIQLARVSASLASYGGKKSKLITIPYTFNNEDHFWRFASSSLAQEILLEPYELGLGMRGLFYAEEGFRHFFSVTPLTSKEDLRGKKIRASNATILQDLTRSLHAQPITINYTDLYMALLTGKIDVADQPLSNYVTNSFSVVAPNLILDGHMLGAVQVIINSTAWDALSERQQNILTEAGAHAASVCRKLVTEEERRILKTLAANGVTITKVEDKKPWQEECKAMIEDYSSGNPELYKKIRELGD